MGESPLFVPAEGELRLALERDEFVVYYQPIVDLVTGHLAAAEALVRWQHPRHGLLSPASFIEVAEATGLSVPLAEYVHRTALAQARAWEVAGLNLPCVSLNLSTRQFRPGYLSEFLGLLLAETGVMPTRVALELHEEVMPDPAVAEVVLAELSTLGIPLWIDDFGTGPSGVRYLTRFPFAVLKIDREFVWAMVDDPRWVTLVGALAEFARRLGLRSVAEGVISDELVALLRAQNVDLGQGWHHSPPLPVDEMTALLRGG